MCAPPALPHPLHAQGKRAAVENLLGRLQEQRAARPLTPPASRPAGAEVGAQEGAASAGGGAADGDQDDHSPDTTPKPFLKRKSRKVVGSKVDWSHVKPRTVSRCRRGLCTLLRVCALCAWMGT